MKSLPLLFMLAMIFSVTAFSQNSGDHNQHNDKVQITKVINQMVKGIDKQDGKQIETAFREGASLNATAPDMKSLITMPPQNFAAAHQQKRFGGHDREVRIEYLDITDGVIASAKVIAFSDQVHYTYYLTFSNTDGKWLIQSFLQRSKMIQS